LKKHYLTGLEALNYHGIDWHSFAFDFNMEYPELVRNWCGDYGIEKKEDREIANPVRAFLDYLLYEIKFEKRIPIKRVSDLAFSDEEEKEIAKQVKEKLKRFLKDKEREILEKWIHYNEGGEYEFTNVRLLKRKAWKERRKKTKFNFRNFRESFRKIFTKKSSEDKLKIEISLRNNYTPIQPLKPVKESLKIYNINDLLLQKLSSFPDKTTAGDLYDIAFIVDTYYSQLDYNIKQRLFNLLKSEERIYDFIPEYEKLFKSDRVLDELDLLVATTRLMKFFKEMKKDFKMQKHSKWNEKSENKHSKKNIFSERDSS